MPSIFSGRGRESVSNKLNIYMWIPKYIYSCLNKMGIRGTEPSIVEYLCKFWFPNHPLVSAWGLIPRPVDT